MEPELYLKDLVLLGGGHAHVYTVKMLGMEPIKGVRVTLVTKDIDTPVGRSKCNGFNLQL